MQKNQNIQDDACIYEDDAYVYAKPDCSEEICGIIISGIITTAIILCKYFNII